MLCRERAAVVEPKEGLSSKRLSKARMLPAFLFSLLEAPERRERARVLSYLLFPWMLLPVADRCAGSDNALSRAAGTSPVRESRSARFVITPPTVINTNDSSSPKTAKEEEKKRHRLLATCPQL